MGNAEKVFKVTSQRSRWINLQYKKHTFWQCETEADWSYLLPSKL